MSNVDDGVRNGVCMYCGSGVLSSGDHVRDEPCPGPPMTPVDIGKLYGVCRRVVDIWDTATEGERMNKEGEAFLYLLKAEPTLLDPAPAGWTGKDINRRTADEVHPCLRCGQRADNAFVADTKSGPCWLDLCHECSHRLLRGGE